MKLKLSWLALLPFFFSSSVRAMLIHEIRFNANAFIISPGLSEARSDANPDASTVRVTLSDNPLAKRWELRFWGWQTGTRDLTAGLDVTTDTDISIRLQKYPKAHPMGVRAIYIDGMDVRDLQYSDTTDMVEFKFRPVKPVISASHSGEITAFAGVVFPYSGMKVDPATIRMLRPSSSAMSFAPTLAGRNILPPIFFWGKPFGSTELRVRELISNF